MEVLPYLRARPRAVAILVLLPLLAAAAAYSLVRARPAGYTATAQVTVPPGADGSAGSITIFAGNFGLALGSAPVLDQVAAATGQTTGQAASSVEYERIGQSSRLSVVYTADSSQAALAGATTASEQGLVRLASDVRDQQATELARLEGEFGARQAALQELQDRTGLLFPLEEYQDVTQQLLDAQLLERRSALANNPVGVATAQSNAALLATRQQELAGPAQEYLALQDQVETAADDLRGIRGSFAGAEAAALPETADGLVGDPVVGRASSTSQTVQAVVGAAAIAFVLTFVVLVGPDLLRRRGPRPVARRSDLPDESSRQVESTRPLFPSPVQRSSVTRGAGEEPEPGSVALATEDDGRLGARPRHRDASAGRTARRGEDPV